MSQTPPVSSTSQNQTGAGVPTQHPDGTNALPSTTTDTGAELASEEPARGKQSDGTPEIHCSTDDQAATTSTPQK